MLIFGFWLRLKPLSISPDQRTSMPSLIHRGSHASEADETASPILAAWVQGPGVVLCLAHVTNQMGRVEGDFEKGVADGAEESLSVISHVARRWRDRARP